MEVIAIILFLNASIAFFIAFYFQALVVIRIFGNANFGFGIGDSNSAAANFLRFLNGEIHPELRAKWLKSVLWVVVSYIAVFRFAVIDRLVTP